MTYKKFDECYIMSEDTEQLSYYSNNEYDSSEDIGTNIDTARKILIARLRKILELCPALPENGGMSGEDARKYIKEELIRIMIMAEIEDIITKVIEAGNFENFDRLPEKEQVKLMKNWNRKMWNTFMLRNTVSEEEVFDPIFRLIEEDEEE